LTKMPELLERILVQVLADFKSNPKLALKNFLKCRQVSTGWREGVDSIIRRLDKIPELKALDSMVSITDHEYFADFAVPVKDVKFAGKAQLRLLAPALLPHYRDFIIHNLALRSKEVSFDQESIFEEEAVTPWKIPAHVKPVQCLISSRFAIVAHKDYERIRFYSLRDMTLSTMTMQVPSDGMRIVTMLNQQGTRKEYLVFKHGVFLSYVDLSVPQMRIMVMGVVPKYPKGPSMRCIAFNLEDKDNESNEPGDMMFSVRNDDISGGNLHSGLEKVWPSYNATRKNFASYMWHHKTEACREIMVRGFGADYGNDPDVLSWVFCYGKFRLSLTVSGRLTFWRHDEDLHYAEGCSVELGKFMEKIPREVFEGGNVTTAHMDSNVLFLGTDNGRMNAYFFRTLMTMEKDVDLRKPDFGYEHELAKPVVSISTAKYVGGSVKILVLFEDRVKIISKKPSSDFCQDY